MEEDIKKLLDIWDIDVGEMCEGQNSKLFLRERLSGCDKFVFTLNLLIIDKN